jgi:hypothetical protein
MVSSTVKDPELSGRQRLVSEIGKSLSEVSEVGALLRDDPVAREILGILLFSERPVSGEKLYRLVVERLRESGLSVSRAAFYRRLRRLVRDGLVLATGSPSKRTRQGPYMVWPGFKSSIGLILEYLYRDEYKKNEKSLRRWICSLVKSLRERDSIGLLESLDRLDNYFAGNGRVVFRLMLYDLLRLHEAQVARRRGSEVDKELTFIIDKINTLPEDLKKHAIIQGQMLAILPYIILFQLKAPLEAMYKAIIKEEC